MKMKRLVSAIAALAMSVSAFAGLTVSAATAEDIVPISSTATYWFEDWTSMGTVKTTKGELYGDNHFFAVTGNSVSTGKGSNNDHLNCLRFKNVQDMLQFEVSKPAEITMYTYSDSKRGVVASKTVPGGYYGNYDDAVANANGYDIIAVQPVSTTEWTFSVNEATTICLSNYGGDLYTAGIKVVIETTEPTISVSPTSKTINLGDTLKINATTQNTGDAEIVWTSDNEDVATVADGVVTSVAPGTANITATVTVNEVDYSAVCAVTVQDVATVTFDISNVGGVTGTAPEDITVTKGEIVTIPVNNSLYMGDGISLKGWDIGSGNVVATGSELALTNDITARPVFAYNEVNLGDEETSATFYFGVVNGAPVIEAQGSHGVGSIIVAQAAIGEEVIDVKMDIDASNGKFNNAGRGDVWAQVNGGTILTVPVIAGSVVTVGDIYNDAGTYTIGGVECTGDGGTYTATEDGTVEIVAGAESGSYWSSVTVTYPKKVEKTMPTVAVAEFGTYTENAGNPAKAFTGTFTVDETVNNPVNCVKWTVGEATAVSGFGTTISSGTVVTGLVVVAADLDAIPAPTAEALFAE